MASAFMVNEITEPSFTLHPLHDQVFAFVSIVMSGLAFTWKGQVPVSVDPLPVSAIPRASAIRWRETSFSSRSTSGVLTSLLLRADPVVQP